MIVRHLSAADFRTSNWSGGTTTELYLYPANGSYAARDFLFRISSATVDLEESDFTPLPGVERHITPLQGSFVLTHPGSSPIEMPPLAAPYRFSGAIPTHCMGKAKDFNLMLKDCEGDMALHRGSAPIRAGFNGFYAVESGVFSINEQRFEMKQGDLLTVFSQEDGVLELGNAPTLTSWVKL
jgi:environmental stress-induced protein Ves